MELAVVHEHIRGFIKQWRSENSLSTTHNFLAKFQRSMAIFYSDESDVDTLCKEKLVPEMHNFSASPLALPIS